MAKTKRKNKYKSKYKRKYAAGGSMYSDNTVNAAGQGAIGSTANIVFEQNNPQILQQKLDALKNTKNEIQASSKAMSNEIANQEAQDEIAVQNAALESEQKTNAVGNTIGSTLKSSKEFTEAGGLGNKAKEFTESKQNKSSGVGGAVNAYKAQRAANLGVKATKGAADGTNLITNAGAASKAVNALPEGASIMSSAETGKTIVVDAGGNIIKGGGSSLGAGLASAAKNPNVLAAAANVAGKTISHFSDDDDATTWTAGEATGDILGTAGEYAGYGAMLTSWLGPGAGIGAAVGGIVGAGVGIYKGITGRNKAKKEERKRKNERQAKVDKYNKEVKEDIGGQLTSTRSAEIAAKTTSGYDLGRNVVAKYGGYRNAGMRMGMPRYGLKK